MIDETRNGRDNVFGKTTQTDAEKIDGESVSKQLRFIHRTIAKFLNQANVNVSQFLKHIVEKVRVQDGEITAISDSLTRVRKSYDRLIERIHKLDYKLRNAQFQKKPKPIEHEKKEASKPSVLGLLALVGGKKLAKLLLGLTGGSILGALGFWAWYNKKQDEEQPTQEVQEEPKTEEPKPEPKPEVERIEPEPEPIALPEVEVKPEPQEPIEGDQLKLHKSLIELNAEMIKTESQDETEFKAVQKIVFKADEIIIESDEIRMEVEPTIDGSAKVTVPAETQETQDSTSTSTSTKEQPLGTADDDYTPETPQSLAQEEEGEIEPIDEEQPTPEVKPPETPPPSTSEQVLKEKGSIMEHAPHASLIEDRRDEPQMALKAPDEPLLEGEHRQKRPGGNIPIPQGGIKQAAANMEGTQTAKDLGIEQIGKGKISNVPPATKAQFLTAKPEPEPEFTVTVGGMGAGVQDSPGVFGSGMFGNYGQQAAQKMKGKMSKEQWDKLPQDVKDHVNAAYEGRGKFDLNFVMRRTAPLMTREELEKTKKEMAGGSITLNEPKGWKTPDERPKPPPPKPVEKPTETPKEPDKQTSPEQKPSDQAAPPPSDATPIDKPPDDGSKIEPAPKPAPSGPSKEEGGAPPAQPPADQPQEAPPQTQEMGPTSDDPERESGRAQSGSYGGMKSSRDHNSGICMI